MLEIGYWRRISRFWHEGHTPETFLDDLRSFHAPNLGPKVGKIYMDTVGRCIGGSLTEEGTDNAESQKKFYWGVVRELSRLVA
jgi:hypothetical protein